jgi:hypothetical protein
MLTYLIHWRSLELAWRAGHDELPVTDGCVSAEDHNHTAARELLEVGGHQFSVGTMIPRGARQLDEEVSKLG